MQRDIKVALAGVVLGATLLYLYSYAVQFPASGEESASTPATAQQAAAFIATAEAEFESALHQWRRANWVQGNFLTQDTTDMNASAQEAYTALAVNMANQSGRFDGVEVSPPERRKLDLMRQALVLPAPADPARTAELTRLSSGLKSAYASARYCRPDGSCLADVDIIKIMANSRDPDELLDVWQGWHAISRGMKDDYARMVHIANEGARELGYADTGALWRSKYDMPPDALAAEADRLWGQVKPLYDSLHCYTRERLKQKYGALAEGANGMMPGHLLGNIWAQEWGEIGDIVAPASLPGAAFELDGLLRAKNYEPLQMVKQAEAFYSSLGFAPLPATFWQRSLFTKPRDRIVQCHGSAGNIRNARDVRIKMCIDVTGKDFVTIHHELGHDYYYRAYARQPPLFRASAHDGFHEAVGDFVALSITPSYLKQIGLIDEEPSADADIRLLLDQALDKVAGLPWTLLVDKWRWQVFSGEVTPEHYNAAWWKLREQYQGISAPIARSEADFDAGAKNHVPRNTPYLRYFFARILQFQFHKAACEQAGWSGPLHRCSIYGNKEVGRKLEAMLAMGNSQPWPDALQAFSGTRDMDGAAIIAYFAPLQRWLDQQNAGQSCGWTPSG